MSPQPQRSPDYVLHVGGMMCQQNCGGTVQRALEAVANVQKVMVSFAEAEASVWGEEASILDLIAAVGDVGVRISVLVCRSVDRSLIRLLRGPLCAFGPPPLCNQSVPTMCLTSALSALLHRVLSVWTVVQLLFTYSSSLLYPAGLSQGSRRR